MDSSGESVPLHTLTVEDLRLEFKRFASDILSREFLVLGNRLEKLEKLLEGKVSAVEKITSRRTTLSRNTTRRTRSSMHSSYSLSGDDHGTQSRTVGAVASSMAELRRVVPSMKSIRASETRDSIKLSLLRNSNLSMLAAEQENDADVFDASKECFDDEKRGSLQLPVRIFPKCGATSTTTLAIDEYEPLINDNHYEDALSIGSETYLGFKRRHHSVGNLITKKTVSAGRSTAARSSEAKLDVRFEDQLNFITEEEEYAPDDEDADGPQQRPSLCQRCVESDLFHSSVVWLLISNLVFVGIETDYLARHWLTKGPMWFKSFEAAFCVGFVLEIVLRTAAYGCNFFLDWGNNFDCCLVLTQVTEMVFSFQANESLHTAVQFRMLRVMRLIRMFRAVRLFRTLQHVNELKALLSSMVETFRPLFWMLLLLTVTSAMFAILLTQIATEYKLESNDVDDLNDLEEYYGSMDRAMLSLYQIISDGIHWHMLLKPLADFASPWIQIAFVIYIALTVLAMMNVIMGIFVDSVARTAEHSKKRQLLLSMAQLFVEADTDGSGTLDVDEFEAILEHPLMAEYLGQIDLDPRDARELFKLLDAEGIGEIDPEDWLNGCLTLTGPAKSLDIATIRHEQRFFVKRWNAHSEFVEDALSAIEDRVLCIPLDRMAFQPFDSGRVGGSVALRNSNSTINIDPFASLPRASSLG